MTCKRKTWLEKRDLANQPKVETISKKFADIPAGGTILIATPRIVEAYIRQIPEGQAGYLKQMRKDLAAEYGTQYTCPLTAGIFLRIVAEAAWEEMQQGKKSTQVAPFWRIIPPDSPAAKKLTFGTEFLRDQQHQEGIFV
jgi:hypothetical protein